MKNNLNIAINRFSKRQMTWFKNRSNVSKNLNYKQDKNYIKKKINNF